MYKVTNPFDHFGEIKQFSSNFVALAAFFQNPDKPLLEEDLRNYNRLCQTLSESLPALLKEKRKAFVREEVEYETLLDLKFFKREDGKVTVKIKEFLDFFKELFKETHDFTWPVGGFPCRFSVSGTKFVVRVPDLDIEEDIDTVYVYFKSETNSFKFNCVSPKGTYIVYADPKYVPF